MAQFLLAQESGESRSPALLIEQLLNCFTERVPEGSKTPIPLFGAPGLSLAASVGPGPIRAITVFNGLTHIVSGTHLYRININSTVTDLGGTIPGSNIVSIADNGVQICIINGLVNGGGAGGWIYSVAGGLVQITSPNFFPCDTVTFFDGYFVFDRAGTAEFFLSALYDGTTFSGTDFATTESSSQPVNAIAENLQLLFFFKSDRIELWYDAGAADFPFQRYAGGVINRGCTATYSMVKQDGAIFFLGDDAVVYRLQANVPIRVSTPAMESLIAQEANPSLISGFTYTWQGHKFVGFTLPGTTRTIVYDVSTGKWHERQSYDSFGTSLGWWRAWVAYDGHFGNPVLGDRTTGSIWKPDITWPGEGTNPMFQTVISTVLQKDRKRVFVNRFEIDMQNGVANSNAPTPVATLFTSTDGGFNWENRGSRVYSTMTTPDVHRVRWTNLGQARQWVFKIVLNDPVTRNIIGAYVDAEIGQA